MADIHPPLDSAPAEPIAVIGIGCRFPGDAHDPDSFWRNLLAGVDAVGDVPPDRWSVPRLFDPRPGVPGRSYARWGGFLRRIDEFEPEAFGMSPREARHVDPQQRLLLETAWEAMEDGGQPVHELAGTPTGVFIGVSTTDYANLQSTIHDMRGIDAHTGTGGATSIVANRISYCFDLRGPSIAVDTACSSSLVAVHLACRSLWAGESALALAGGVNVIISASHYVAFSAATMLSPEGRCKAFDAGADGFVRSEGAGMVLLKPLARAVADGDRIYAVVLATGVNQDGRTSGISLPNQASQEDLVRETCRRAGVPPSRIQYVEAHGTGTAVGDPIEANAIGGVLAAGREPADACVLGSVKSVIGHLEAGAGIAGFIKTVLAIRHRRIPPNLHFTRPNPLIAFEALRLRVPVSPEPWPREDAPLLAGVNSFGFGGTNAHVILCDVPRADVHDGADGDGTLHAAVRAGLSDGAEPRPHLLPISARTPEALHDLAAAWRDALGPGGSLADTPLADLCHTARTRRSRHEHGLSVIVRDRAELRERLDAFLAGETRPGLFAGKRAAEPPPILFAFCGQGAQWAGMGRGLLDHEPVFRDTIRACDRLLAEHADWSLWSELTAEEGVSRLHETAVAQPAIFAVQVALAALWKSWGITPSAVIGHSVGEIAAAHVAGFLTLPEAVRIVYHRARTMDCPSSKGAMMAVGLSHEEARAAIAGFEQSVAVAASNSPRSATLSGKPEALAAVAQRLAERDVFTRRLKVDYAFHSPLLDPVHEDLIGAIGTVRTLSGVVPMFSAVTGELVRPEDLTADYWWRGMRDRVHFAEAVDRALDDEIHTFLELGPHPALSGYIAECLHHRARKGTALPSLRRKEGERIVLLGSLGALHTLGHDVEWSRLWPEGGRVVRVPGHPWRRQSYWHESPELNASRLSAEDHPFLSRDLRTADPAWQVPLDLRVLSYLVDHRVDKHAVFPAAGFVEAAVAAGRRALGRERVTLEDVRIPRALILSEEGGEATLQVRIDPDEGTFTIQSGTPGGDGEWVAHCAGSVNADAIASPEPTETIAQLRGRLTQTVDVESCYARFAGMGLHYGPAFRGMREIHRGDNEALGDVSLPDPLRADGYILHPALLDACFHVLLAAAPEAAPTASPTLFLPVHIRRLTVYRAAGARVHAHARIVRFGARILDGDLDIFDDEQNLVARIEGFRCQAIDRNRAADSEDPLQWIFEVRWENKPHPRVLEGPHAARSIPPVAEIAKAALSEGTALAARLGLLTTASAAYANLERSALAWIARFVHRAGVDARPGARFTEHEVAERLGARPHLRKLLHCFLQHLEQAEFVTSTGQDTWEVRRDFREDDAEAIWRDVWRMHPAFHTELNLIGRCGSHLDALFRGNKDPMEVLFPDGPASTVAALYQSAPVFRVTNRAVEAAVRHIQKAQPEGAILRVLEVGGGTGGLTAHLLPVLDPITSSYLFTDISPLFVSKAEQRFGDHPFARFRAFDIEADARRQGLGPQTFDVIVASDVLHAVADLRGALGGLHALLAPGGVLLMVEGERKSPLVDLIFGLMEGWWKFEDLDLRPDYPLLEPEQWMRVFEESGFEGAEALPLRSGGNRSSQIVLLARRPMDDALVDIGHDTSHPIAAPGLWLLFTDRTGVGREMEAALRARGARCVVVETGESYRRIDADRYAASPDRPEDIARVIEALDPATDVIRGIAHLWSLDAAPPDATTLETMRRTEALGCHSVLHLVQAMTHAGRFGGAPRLVLVTRGAQATDEGRGAMSAAQAALIGLGRVLINEHPDIDTRMIDLARTPEAGEAAALFEELWTEDLEEEVALRRESRMVPRGVRVRPKTAAVDILDLNQTDFRLTTSTSGIMDQLAWREIARRAPGPGEVEIRVEAAGLNFRDVLKSLALYPAEEDDYLLLGDECAGRVTALGPGVSGLAVGDAVMTMARGSFAGTVIADANTVFRKPDGMSFEEAATMPVAFLTATYALHHLARLRAGETVLVHAGAGGVGMAAIQIARRAGAIVLASAGSPEKREILRLLGVEHVFDSRSLAFADEILRVTGGRGADIVLNSLSGRAIQKGLSCTAPFGRFLELGKRDIQANSRLGLFAFRRNISFHVVDLGSMGAEQPALLRELFAELKQRFDPGEYRPLPYTVFPAARAVDAFRYVAQARHIGKVVLSMREPGLRVESRPEGPIAFRADASYLVTGGLGGFGLVVARWIAERGGGNLILIGRSGASSEEAQAAVLELEARGVRVLAMAADVARADDLRAVLDRARAEMPPLRGVFHSAVAFDDGIVLQLDRERFSRVMDVKAAGAWNLHALTLDHELDHFVLFSSVSSWVGTPGQGNYVAANAFLDAFAHHRRSLGLPALTIDWGRLDEVGYVARHAEVGEILTRRGFVGFSPKQAMVGLERMMQSRQAQLGFLRLDWNASAGALGGMRVAQRVTALFGDLVRKADSEDEGSRLREALRSAKPDARPAILGDYLRHQVARVLGASAASLDADRPLNQLGFDSLMAVELKNHIDADLALSLPIRAMMEAPTINTLTAAVAELMDGRRAQGSAESKTRISQPDPSAASVPR
jgi:acyl transferase domain-containing protein/NADPH:quinone reductase-like Zn-dependent oxidoreductase/SAM-dependent methyltransferase/acyl carrier protein